jgi:hypothetical protein
MTFSKAHTIRRIICIALCFLAAMVFIYAQRSTVKIPKTFTHYINEPEQSIKVSVMATKVEITPKEELTYFWFSSNKVLFTKGGFDGYLLHGIFSSFYANKNLKEKGCYKNGLREGKWMAWFENGQIREILNYHNGKKTGRYELYNELGLPMVKARFRNDKLHGRMYTFLNNKIQTKQRFRNGNEIKRTEKKEEEIKPPKEKKRKEKIRKEEKEEAPKEKKEENKKVRKTFKEKWNNLFKKKKERK